MVNVAIFDLDRTLIAGSSAQLFGKMLQDLGVDIPQPPGRSLYFSMYERFGEDPVTMRVARFAARLLAGQQVRTVETAGRMAADVLASDLLPAAEAELAHHRGEGATLLLATTAPRELAEPFAEAAGLDAVLCTVYRSVDGLYDGTNESPYVWGAAKSQQVATWAAHNEVDLTASTAYSDSWYDVPLLDLVGAPVAVNADMRLAIMARARRWERRSWGPG